MPAYVGSVEQWAAGASVALSSGGQVDLFSPNAVPSKTNGDTESLLIEFTSSIAPVSAQTMVNVQGLLGALAHMTIKDKNNRVVKNWTGPQLVYWYFLKTGKYQVSNSVSGTATVTPAWQVRMPCSLPSRFGPYTITAKGAPFGEIATQITSATISLTVSQVYGRASSLVHEDYIALSGLVEGSPTDITAQFPAGQMMDRWALVIDADADFTSLTLHKNRTVVYEALGGNFFIQSAFNSEPQGSFAADIRPAGLLPIPFRHFARGLGDLIKLNLADVDTLADPAAGVNQGSTYNPLAILFEELLE